MSVIDRLEKLDPKQRALLAIALIVDGREAIDYLKIDSEYGEQFRKIAEDLGALDPELRISLLGTILRKTLVS